MVRNRRSLGKAFTPNKLAKKKAHAAEPANEKPASMKVVVRVRPPNERELEGNVRKVVEVVSDEGLVFDPQEPEDLFFYHGSTQRNRDVTRRKNKNSEFVFDRVFGENASNNDVYEYSTREILKALFDGYNCSVFAYGATGSGKTFTMLGNKENPGIAYQTMVELYRRVHDLSEEFEFDIRVSYLEVYNENVRDLLQPASKHLHLREDASNGVTVPGLTVSRITCADELFARLSQGNVNRSQHPTDSNAESSRSHAVFQTYIHSRVKTTKQQKLVKLSMIDLAGSEKASATGGRGARFCEGQNINRSLLALGNCINSLAAGSKFVPYRDSKLTRLLKDSLGGNCKTVMIANISPCSNAYEDTHRTLKYAERAKMIKLKIAKNVVASGFSRLQYDKLVETIQSENAALKAELAALKEELSALRLKLKSLEDERQQQSGAGPPGDADTGEVRVPPAETATVGSPPGPSGDLEVIQERKKELYQKLCADERALKRLQWKCYRRLVTTRRLNSLGSDHKELERKESRMRTFVRAALQQARQLRDSLGRHGRELEALRELEAAGDPLPARAQLEMKVHNSELQMDHMKELLKIAFVQNERDDAVIRMLCGTLKSFYLLLKAYGKVTDTMNQEYKECLKMIEGDKAVTFSAVKDGCRDKGRDELAGVASLTWESGQLASCGEGPAPGPSFDRWLGQVTGLLEEVELNSARRESIALGCTPVKLNATFCKEAEPEPEPLPEDAPGVVFEDTFVLAVAPSEDPGSARPDEQLPLRLRSSIPVNTLGFRTAASIGLVPVELGEQNKENSEALFKKPAKKQLKFASPRPLLAPRNAAPAPTGIRLPLKIRGQASSLGLKVPTSKPKASVPRFHPYRSTGSEPRKRSSKENKKQSSF
ncbi:kinesin-like protein KIF18A isoform X2 [Bacillus rossius redtenbacheri]|uniref:kinesin-like protein KIF18A isoform X2 n=1 Tax=Bacillus rossius redtenbacheri TaxID=93214 RepID=UPI002FDD512F